jgi:hypothetical protein
MFEEPHVRLVARRLQLALDNAVSEVFCSSSALA